MWSRWVAGGRFTRSILRVDEFRVKPVGTTHELSGSLPTGQAPIGNLLSIMERIAAGSPDVELSGEYDLARKQEVAALFAAVNGKASITIDMREVTYVDSTFLNELVRMR